jgi:NAD(P)-dependent dehydrogenase (short-subunit alcohol dehydrogenase family)
MVLSERHTSFLPAHPNTFLGFANHHQDMSSEGEVWFITGCSKGIGKAYALYGLENGKRVVATARKSSKMSDMAEKYGDKVLTYDLDVTDQESIKAAVKAAVDRFGRIDVLISNAGYNLIGPVEELTDEFLRPLFETNFFGALALVRAVLPIMREQKSGFIVQVSSVHGTTTTPGYGGYSATKCALEGAFEALADEIAPFGIRTMLVKPGAFKTDVLNPKGNCTFTKSIGVYDDYELKEKKTELNGNQSGDPDRLAAATDEALHASDPPRLLLLGKDCYDSVTEAMEKRSQEIKQWEHLSKSTDFK